MKVLSNQGWRVEKAEGSWSFYGDMAGGLPLLGIKHDRPMREAGCNNPAQSLFKIMQDTSLSDYCKTGNNSLQEIFAKFVNFPVAKLFKVQIRIISCSTVVAMYSLNRDMLQECK